MIQGSEEWHAIRCGKVTASRIADVMARTKTGISAMRTNYVAELVAERLTGQPAERFVSGPMQWGTDNEAAARDAYAFYSGLEPIETGFHVHPTFPMAGASPDGLIGAGGLLEIKCPNTATHIDTLLRKTIDRKYLLQMQFQMDCACRIWCDFVSFDPRLPEEMRLFVQRVERDDDLLDEIHEAVETVLEEVDDTVKKLRAAYA